MASKVRTADDLSKAISFALDKRNVKFSLKSEQTNCIESVVHGKDTLGVLPTGYGKSLIFQLLPDIFNCMLSCADSIILVVSPLNALMEEQVDKLNSCGISACMIKGNSVCVSDDQQPLSSIKNPSFQIIYFHPEVVNNKQFTNILKAPEFQKRVRCIVTDESHLVVEWVSFRPSYGQLDMLANLFPDIPQLALTATATKSTQRNIISTLLLRDPNIIEVSPDRRNIFFEVLQRPARGENKLEPILAPIIKELKEKKVDMELTLIYGNLETCADCFISFSSTLGKEQYYPPGAEHLSKNRLFAQYHAEYPQHEKERLVQEMVEGRCKARVLFVTVAFGMGIDIPNIRRIIHVGVPHTMEEFFQEAGRAGRDGAPATASLYYNSYDIAKRKNGIQETMREYVTTKECRRKVILSYFGHALLSQTVLHYCCDNDKVKCDCSACLVTATEEIERELEALVIEEHPKPPSVVTEEEKLEIRKDLEEYRSSLYRGKSCVGGITLSSGFSMELIDEVIEKCDELTSIEIIQHTLPVYSKSNAEVIFSILSKYIAK